MSLIERVADWFFGHAERGLPDWTSAAGISLSDIGAYPISVNADQAMRVSAVFACVRIIADTVASLPLVLYRRRADGSRERATDHALYHLLHDQPNPLMSAFEARWAMVAHLATRGNAYYEIQRDGAGRIVALWPMLPDHVSIEVRDDALTYRYQPPGRPAAVLPARDVWHVRVFSLDGIIGMSPLAYARRAVELATATEEFGLRFFSRGANPRLVLRHPGRLSAEAAQRLRESWESAYGGLSNAHRVAILEEGMAVDRLTIPPEEAQFLETRRMQIAEIARIYRIPLHMLQELDRATHANIEHQQIEFLTQSLRPWLIAIEQAVQRLLTSEERALYYAEHLVDGLLRGDIGARYRAYATALQWGFMSVNEVRRLENMDAVPGGDAYLRPLNMQAIGGNDGADDRAPGV